MRTAFRSASMDGKLSLRWLPAMLLAVVCFSVGSSWLFDWKQGDVTMLAMARERGAALFRLVELTRDVLGKAASLLKSGRHSKEFFIGMWRTLRRDGRWQGEVWNRHQSGQVYVVWLSIVQVAGAGQPVRYVATLADITQRKEVEEELCHQAYHDPLTDLPNRALFADRLRVALLQAQRHARKLKKSPPASSPIWRVHSN